MTRLIGSLRRSFFLGSHSARPRRTDPRRGRLAVEQLEDRTLLAVQFTPGPLTTPAHRPNVPLGGISRFRPTVPALAVNGTDPGNIAVASHEGLRLSGDAGGSFPRSGAFSPSFSFGGITGVQFDGQGRLFWSNEASLGSSSGVYVDQVDPNTGAVLAANRATTDSSDDPREQPDLGDRGAAPGRYHGDE
jgi:hypothetical protein